MSENKTHYRKVFKSDHLGAADLEEMTEEGKKLIFTFKEVKQEYGAKVAGKTIDANIGYFNEEIKPLVLNSTNSKQMAKFAGSKFVEDWAGLTVELFIDASVKLKGEVVGGVRIRPTQPVLTKPELTPDHPRWDEARDAVKYGKLEGVQKSFSISDDNLLKLQEK